MKRLQRDETTELNTTIGTQKNEASYFCCVDRICQGFALVERVEESIEALARFNDSFLNFDVGMNAYIILASLRRRL